MLNEELFKEQKCRQEQEAEKQHQHRTFSPNLLGLLLIINETCLIFARFGLRENASEGTNVLIGTNSLLIPKIRASRVSIATFPDFFSIFLIIFVLFLTNFRLSEQNIRDRYYGVNDPVADKLLKRAASLPVLEPPSDKTITTLYVGNVGEHLTEVDIRDQFYHYGEIRNVTLVQKQQCAFVQFTKRSGAELAAEKTFNKLVLGGKKLSIRWAYSQVKQQGQQGGNNAGGGALRPRIDPRLDPVPGVPDFPNPNDYFNLNASEMCVLPPGMKIHQIPTQYSASAGPSATSTSSGGNNIHYASQDPNALGSMKK